MKTTYMYLGEMQLYDYSLVVIAESNDATEHLLLQEWQRNAHKNGTDAKFPIDTATFEQLQDHLEVSVRQIPIGQVVWP